MELNRVSSLLEEKSAKIGFSMILFIFVCILIRSRRRSSRISPNIHSCHLVGCFGLGWSLCH